MLNDIDSPESVEVGRLSEVFPDVNERLNGGFGCYKCTEKLTAMPVEVQGLDPISCSG
jgi:hypothetical protein